MNKHARLGLLVAVLAAAWCFPVRGEDLTVRLRSQSLKPDAGGHNGWEVVERTQTLRAAETAIIVCDMWDKHWSRGATERVAAMAPRMNDALKAARAKGVAIVHCPSETMGFYRDSPARRRATSAPHADMPQPATHDDPPQPIDAGDGGSDTGEKPWHQAWTRQHPAIEIDDERDAISDNGQEVWNFLAQRGVKNVIVMGVHTNMCVLHRPFAIKALVRRGMNVTLVRDLTDTMYNPARPPYVSHDEGTRLVVAYIEKFWCPTISSADLIGDKPRE